MESLILFIEVSWLNLNLKNSLSAWGIMQLLGLHFPVYLPSLKSWFYIIYYLVGFAWSSFFNHSKMLTKRAWISLLHFCRFIYLGWKITGLPQSLIVIIFFIFCKVLSLTVNILRLVLLQNDSGHWSEMLLSLQVNCFKNNITTLFCITPSLKL